MWRASRNGAGRQECSLVMNCLRMIDKKVDNPEDQSWVKVEFQKFACQEVWLYRVEGRRKADEENANKPVFSR